MVVSEFCFHHCWHRCQSGSGGSVIKWPPRYGSLILLVRIRIPTICQRFKEMSLYAPYSLLLISNKFWMGGGGEGGSAEGRREGENKRSGGVGAGRLSYFMQLSGPSSAIKFLYAPAPPPPTVWALKPSSWALHLLGLSRANTCVCKCGYAGMHT